MTIKSQFIVYKFDNEKNSKEQILSKNAIKLSGSYNYFLEISSQGELPYHTSTIVVNAFTNKNKKEIMPIKCIWSKKMKNTTNILKINSNTFILSANDTGYTIFCEVHPMEEPEFNHSGVAKIEIGPIQIDVVFKAKLEQMLEMNFVKFAVNFFFEESGNLLESLKDLAKSNSLEIKMKKKNKLILNNDYVTIFDYHKNAQLKTKYTSNYPESNASLSDVTKLTILFKSESLEKNLQNTKELNEITHFTNGTNKIEMYFESRYERDLFIFALKIFSIKNFMVSNGIVSKINVFLNTFNKDIKDIKIEKLFEIDNIKTERDLLIEKNKKFLNENEKYFNEISRYELEKSRINLSHVNPYDNLNFQSEKNNKRILELENYKKIADEKIWNLQNELNTVLNLQRNDSLKNKDRTNLNASICSVSAFDPISQENLALKQKIDMLLHELNMQKIENVREKNKYANLLNENEQYKNDLEMFKNTVEVLQKQNLNTSATDFQYIESKLKPKIDEIIKENERLIKDIKKLNEEKLDSNKLNSENNEYKILIENLRTENEKIKKENFFLAKQLKDSIQNSNNWISNTTTGNNFSENTENYYKQKIEELEKEKEDLICEKDKLLVELSKLLVEK